MVDDLLSEFDVFVLRVDSLEGPLDKENDEGEAYEERNYGASSRSELSLSSEVELDIFGINITVVERLSHAFDQSSVLGS